MKVTALLPAFTMFCLPATHGQTFSFAAGSGAGFKAGYSEYNPVNFQYARPHYKICALHKAGLLTLGYGLLTGVVGLGLMLNTSDYESSKERNLGWTLFLVGGGLQLAGGSLAVGGGIHDRGQKRVSLIAPKKNEIGIAYNF